MIPYNMFNALKRFFFLRSLKPHDRTKVKSLLKLYQKLDADIAQFQKSSGLKCLEGCGKCCENPKVTTTALELIPLAFDLWQKNEGQTWLDQLSNQTSAMCVFYKPDPLKPGNGRCSVYQLRPLICRLFGFSAMSNKHGDKQLLTCPIIKEKFSKEISLFERNKISIPKTTDYTMPVKSLDPMLAEEVPINEAIQNALEKVGLTYQLKR